jgi:hypothetical protein
MKSGTRGQISFHHLFGLKDLNLRDPELHVDRVIQTFLSLGEAVAARWIQMPKAVLLLQMAPMNPTSGAIYFYDREGENFYMLSFEGADDTLSVKDFAELLPEYDLLRYAEHPELLRQPVPNAAAA